MSDIGALTAASDKASKDVEVARGKLAKARGEYNAAQARAKARAADGILENKGEDEVGNTSEALAAAELALQTALKAKSAGGRRRKSRKTRRRRHQRKTRRSRK